MHTANHARYVAKIRNLLLGAGREGISQYHLNQATRTKTFDVNSLLQVLIEWEGKKWVQCFKTHIYGKRRTTIWRATQLLVDAYTNVHLKGVTPDVPTEQQNPSEPLAINAFRFES